MRTVLLVGILVLNATMLAQEKNQEYQYALIEALKQKNLGNLNEAVKLYRLVIREEPGCAAAYYELGNIYLMTQQNELAVNNLRKAFELEPGDKWFSLAYLNSLGVTGDFDTMEKVLDRKIGDEAGEVEWQYQLATVYLSQEKPRKALRLLEKIERDHGFSEKVTLLKASVYENQEEYELALGELVKVMDLFPEALQFRIAAAELAARSGEVGLSLEYMEEAFRNPQMDLRRKMAVLGLYLSDEEISEKYSPELEQLLLAMLEEHPEEADVHLMASDYYIQGREYEKAYWQLKLYLGEKPPVYGLYMQAVMLANASSLNDELLEVSALALEQYPDSADLAFFRSIGLYEKKDYDSMRELLGKTDFKNFSNEDYRQQATMLLAEAYNHTGSHADADSIFTALISKDPDNYMVLNNYSYYLAERGAKLEQAEVWSRKAIKANPDNSTFLDTYAWVLFKLERFDEAEKYILKALEKGGENDPEVNEHAGDIQLALENIELARSYYMKAVILGGDREKLEEKINALDK